MKEMFFLHGLPRAGNTLLGSLLNQNSKIAVTANSPCADMIGELYMLKHTDIFKNFPDHKSFDNVTKSLFQNYYKDWSADYIIDRNPWGFPINLKFLKSTKRNKNYSLGKRCTRDTSVFYKVVTKRTYIIC